MKQNKALTLKLFAVRAGSGYLVRQLSANNAAFLTTLIARS